MLIGPRALAVATGAALLALSGAPDARAQQTDGKQNVTGGTEARPSEDAARSSTRSMRPPAPPVGAASPPPMPAPSPGSVPAQAPKVEPPKDAPKK
jgi:hypothetical protein